MNLFTRFVLLIIVTQGLGTNTEPPQRDTTATYSPVAREVNTTNKPLPQYRCTAQSCGGKEDSSLYRKMNQFRTDYPGMFVTRCDLFKINWCQSHAAQCPGGRFPDDRSALSDSLKRNCARFNKELPANVRRLGVQFSGTTATASPGSLPSSNNDTLESPATRNTLRANSRTRGSGRRVTTQSPENTSSSSNTTLGSPATRNTLRANSRTRGSGRRVSTQSPASINNITLESPSARDAVVLRASRPRGVANRRVVESARTLTSLSSLRDEVRGDRDRCCQTKNEVVIMAGPMADHRNETCHVISLNDQFYQFAHIGSCYQENGGGCDGTCVQERRLVSLLCLEPMPDSQPNLRPVFRFFRLNAYCSCRSGTVL